MKHLKELIKKIETEKDLIVTEIYREFGTYELTSSGSPVKEIYDNGNRSLTIRWIEPKK